MTMHASHSLYWHPLPEDSYTSQNGNYSESSFDFRQYRAFKKDEFFLYYHSTLITNLSPFKLAFGLIVAIVLIAQLKYLKPINIEPSTEYTQSETNNRMSIAKKIFKPLFLSHGQPTLIIDKVSQWIQMV